ncbi:unnamed protein product [Protopolystoma xenopodis]|uniref:Uncharacterized protein n=1 Tax=Protopolystoma xenopodis TaxID=117903 RepID=A0A448X9Y3_9PLAT|nr:unnamed protein product [Protopolystoma xenopodis]
MALPHFPIFPFPFFLAFSRLPQRLPPSTRLIRPVDPALGSTSPTLRLGLSLFNWPLSRRRLSVARLPWQLASKPQVASMGRGQKTVEQSLMGWRRGRVCRQVGAIVRAICVLHFTKSCMCASVYRLCVVVVASERKWIREEGLVSMGLSGDETKTKWVEGRRRQERVTRKEWNEVVWEKRRDEENWWMSRNPVGLIDRTTATLRGIGGIGDIGGAKREDE